jgi:SAM-dependent methyltransferase
MDDTGNLAEDQSALWNGVAGHQWVETQALLDRIFSPLEDLLVETLPAGRGESLLDIGCGTGSTVLAAAGRLGPAGRATGIDISRPMIDAARQRAEKARIAADFICADAQRYRFEPEAYDRIQSRFGVMFFDGAVEAFSNINLASTPGAPMRLLAWRSPAENPFMTAAAEAAAPLLPELPELQPDAPGQFALADAGRTRNMLAAARWQDIDIRPVDTPCRFDAAELSTYLARLGPVGRILAGIERGRREDVLAAIRPAFDRYVSGGEVRFTAACWLIEARAEGKRA